jgi:hypothetical protein
MSDDRLPTHLIVNACIRTAGKEGVPITVIQRGDKGGGMILLKINRLDGFAHVLTQIRRDDELVWAPLTKTDPMPDTDANALMTKQASFDPDLWVIEIEDKQARLWFPGKRLS